MREDENPHGHRPSDHDQRLVEATDGVDHVPRPVTVVDRQHGEGDRKQGHRDEEQGFERLVSKAVPAGLGMGAECVHDRLVDPEVEDREDEREREG